MKNIMKNFLIASVMSFVCFGGLSCMEMEGMSFVDIWRRVRCDECPGGQHGDVVCECPKKNKYFDYGCSVYDHFREYYFNEAIRENNVHLLKSLIVYWGKNNKLQDFINYKDVAGKTCD